MPFRVFENEVRSILSPVSGFLADAGFTHSLSPSRNCTFGCSYCYVPTMRMQGGLKPEDWKHWGEWTTFKSNAAELLRRSLRPHQVIYCSPLTDPYQPAEEERALMPEMLEVVASSPPKAFVIQTRGPLVLRDIEVIRRIPRLRVSFSITTDREDVRRIFEPHCASIAERLRVVRTLTEAGVATSVAIAPILPCNPEHLIAMACDVSNGPIAVDPFHVRANKASGAMTRKAGEAICERYGWQEWLSVPFQQEVLRTMATEAARRGRAFGSGPSGFGLLAT